MAIESARDGIDRIHRQLAAEGRWADIAAQEQQGLPIAKENRRNAERVAPLPTKAEVNALIEVAFASSLFQEEGRRTGATLAYLAPDGAARLKYESFRFREPLELSAATLAKVAPAADPSRTILAAWPDRNGHLSFWGLVHYGDKRFSIDLEIPRPFFHIEVLGVGAFRVRFDGRLLGSFVRDHWNTLVDPMTLVATIRDEARIDGLVARELCRIARRMREHEHGGTILVIDSAVRRPRGVRLHPSFSGQVRSSMLAAAMQRDQMADMGQGRPEGISDARWSRMRVDLERAHEQALDFVGRLTAVDGALLMRHDLSVVGFGVTVLTSRAGKIPLVFEDPATGVKKPGTLAAISGNRHRAAIHFCAHQKSLAFALVASQDGDLSFFARRKDGNVHVLRPFELGVGV